MSGFLARLGSGPPLLLDGGLGTMLIAAGLPAGQPPEAWVLERPEAVAAIHRAYVEAGSEAVHAATFGGNEIRLAGFGLAGRLEEIQARAVDAARASGARWVLADIGPTGEYLPPVGRGDPDAWNGAFERQIAALASLPVDAFHLETFTDLREARIALAAARRVAPRIPVLASLTFDHRPRGFFTLMGDPPLGSWRTLLAEGAVVVGANCTLTSAHLSGLAAERSDDPLPLVLQPNAGQPVREGDTVLYAQDPASFAAEMAAVARLAGVRAVGGCCGTDPHFIAALRAALDRDRAEP